MTSKKSHHNDGTLAAPGSPAAVEWVLELPEFLRAVILEDWKLKGITLPVQKTDDLSN